MYLIMGPAGAGKSVQGEMLVQALGFEWISTGAVLRQAMNDPDIHSRMERGELLDDSTVEEIVASALKQSKNQAKVILDGFPRDHHQARWLVGFCRGGDMTIDGIIHIEIDLEVAYERLIQRGRTDDHEKAIKKRFDEYHKTTKPILEYFEKQDVNIAQVDGDQTVEEVHQDIMELVQI